MGKFEPVPHRFNYWLASNYWHDAPNIASRFWDCDHACDWSLLACVWHIKNDFGRKIDPVFSVEEIYAASKKEGWFPGDLARVVHACWLGYVADKQREQTDPIVILPPTPKPPPVVVVEEPKKLPEVPVPKEPKKNPAPGLVKFSCYFSMIATAAGAAAFFFPQAKPIVAIVVALVQSILKYFGV
jgi:hypothetical protein